MSSQLVKGLLVLVGGSVGSVTGVPLHRNNALSLQHSHRFNYIAILLSYFLQAQNRVNASTNAKALENLEKLCTTKAMI